MKKLLSNPKKGFTLVELLIVVGIIGILATLLMANFIGVRQRARDAQRKSDLRQIQSALELERSDLGSYPAASGTAIGTCGNALSGGSPANTYMAKIPCDPSGSSYYNSGNYFYTSSGGTTYTLGACLENTADSQGTTTSPGGSGCTSSPATYYVVNNP
ncbi:MAG TPA: type II secretion system protein [Candidatus Sulfotelmatobacter sp.]|nr:type II secretion system protein [Candidatus Sulfotelmatobacter sp.]